MIGGGSGARAETGGGLGTGAPSAVKSAFSWVRDLGLLVIGRVRRCISEDSWAGGVAMLHL